MILVEDRLSVLSVAAAHSLHSLSTSESPLRGGCLQSSPSRAVVSSRSRGVLPRRLRGPSARNNLSDEPMLQLPSKM